MIEIDYVRLCSWIVHVFNWFFNTFCRESNSNIVWFIWTASILFGWVKILFEAKYLLEFLIRHFHWEHKWDRQKVITSMVTGATDKQMKKMLEL